MENNNEEIEELDLNQLMKVRREKLEELQAKKKDIIEISKNTFLRQLIRR